MGYDDSCVYFRIWFVLGVVTISLWGHGKRNRVSAFKVRQHAADLAFGFGVALRPIRFEHSVAAIMNVGHPFAPFRIVLTPAPPSVLP